MYGKYKSHADSMKIRASMRKLKSPHFNHLYSHTMKQYLEFLLLVLILVDSLSTAKKIAKPVKNKNDALIFFNKYGYNPCSEQSGVQCSVSVNSMVRDYQKRFHLKVTGAFDDETLRHMNRPRCGNKDKLLQQLNTAKMLQSKWSRSSLTWSLRGSSTQISQTRTEAIIREAFDAWLEHIPLTITQTCSTCKADFVLDFARDDHDDSYPFDGSGGTLAHAFLPENGRVHFDKDEEWTEKFDGFNTNLYLVAVHEIGHALGLDHNYDTSSIMYPSYQPKQKSEILPKADRLNIASLYGSGSKKTAYSTATTSTTTTTTRSSISSSDNSNPRCRLFVNAAFDFPDGSFHTLNTGHILRFFPDERRWDTRLIVFKRTYHALPNQLAAGVYVPPTRELLIFTNTEVYRYKIDRNSNEANYRRKDSLAGNLRNSIVGAIYYLNQVYVIKKTSLVLFDDNNPYEKSMERDLSEEFPRFSGSVKTAFSHGVDHHFFTSDRLVSVWSERLNSWKTLAKPMETSWFACSNEKTRNIEHQHDRHGHHHDEHHHDDHSHKRRPSSLRRQRP